jgi:hypothetical protein
MKPIDLLDTLVHTKTIVFLTTVVRPKASLCGPKLFEELSARDVVKVCVEEKALYLDVLYYCL